MHCPVPLLPCNKSEASSVLPPLVGGNEGGREKGLGDEGGKCQEVDRHLLNLTPMENEGVQTPREFDSKPLANSSPPPHYLL